MLAYTRDGVVATDGVAAMDGEEKHWVSKVHPMKKKRKVRVTDEILSQK